MCKEGAGASSTTTETSNSNILTMSTSDAITTTTTTANGSNGADGPSRSSSSLSKQEEHFYDSTTEPQEHHRPQRTTLAAQHHQHQIAKLAFCATGICVCYLYYGYLQERLLTSNNDNDNHNHSNSQSSLGPSFVLLTQSVTNVGVAALWQRLFYSNPASGSSPSNKLPLPHRQLLATAFCYVTAMVCSNEAIRYVAYPVQVLAKSCKLLPTMLVGQLVERNRNQGNAYGRRDWTAALAISLGMVLFHFSSSSSSSSTGDEKREQPDDTATANRDENDTFATHYYGTVLLVTSLTMDGVLSSLQNTLKRAPRPPNAVETMLYVNLYAAVVYLYPLCLATGQWRAGVAALTATDHNDSGAAPCYLVATRLATLNAAAALGQVFIFLTIAWFSPVTTTLITTTRKFLTILLSVWVYGHAFAWRQWVAVATVFAGLYLAILATVQKSTATTTSAIMATAAPKIKES